MVSVHDGHDGDVGDEPGFGDHVAFGGLAGYGCAVVLAAMGEWALAARGLVLGVGVLPIATSLLRIVRQSVVLRG